jgi:hypothetical protein
MKNLPTPFIAVTVFALLFVAERFFPLRQATRSLLERLLVRENNSNFCTVFPWWDQLHRTLGVNISQDQVVVGIPGYSLRENNRFWNALLMPFREQRDYWLRPDGTPVEREHSPESKTPPSS